MLRWPRHVTHSTQQSADCNCVRHYSECRWQLLDKLFLCGSRVTASARARPHQCRHTSTQLELSAYRQRAIALAGNGQLHLQVVCVCEPTYGLVCRECVCVVVCILCCYQCSQATAQFGGSRRVWVHDFAEAHDIMCAYVRHSAQCNDFNRSRGHLRRQLFIQRHKNTQRHTFRSPADDLPALGDRWQMGGWCAMVINGGRH